MLGQLAQLECCDGQIPGLQERGRETRGCGSRYVTEQLRCMELLNGPDSRLGESLWVRTGVSHQ